MNNTFVFNHHSLPFASRQSADAFIPEFLKICTGASTSVGLNTILVNGSIDHSWFRVELSRGYLWGDWFNQNKNNNQLKEEIQVFRRITTQSPFFELEEIGSDLDTFDVREKSLDQSFSALRASEWYGSPLCSFPTCSPWDTNPLEVCVETLDNDGNLLEKEKSLLNIHSLSVWESIKRVLIDERNERIANGRALWEKKIDHFPFLVFCGKTSSQLQRWSHGNDIFQQAKDALAGLNNYAEKMKIGKTKGYSDQQLRDSGLGFMVSGESLTVKQTPKLRKEREFYLPNGDKMFFETHVKLMNGFRIHFFPEPAGGVIYVGYIGPHLRLG